MLRSTLSETYEQIAAQNYVGNRIRLSKRSEAPPMTDTTREPRPADPGKRIEFFWPTPNERWTEEALSSWIGKPVTLGGRQYGEVLAVRQIEGGLLVRAPLTPPAEEKP